MDFKDCETAFKIERLKRENKMLKLNLKNKETYIRYLEMLLPGNKPALFVHLPKR